MGIGAIQASIIIIYSYYPQEGSKMESARYKPVLLPTGRHYNGIALEAFSNVETFFFFFFFFKEEEEKRKTNKLLMLVVLYYLPISKLPWNNQLEQGCNKS